MVLNYGHLLTLVNHQQICGTKWYLYSSNFSVLVRTYTVVKMVYTKGRVRLTKQVYERSDSTLQHFILTIKHATV